jgi:hypothetical protein
MDAPGGIGWTASVVYCDELVLGGFDDWRMPSIDELRTLVRECPATEAGGGCEVTELCLDSECAGAECDGCTYLEGPDDDGCYWDSALSGLCSATVHWSSSLVQGQASQYWGILFGTGAVLSESGIDTDTEEDTSPPSCDTIVRCVRGTL